jgi:drug/metabolite transporter (DMT)-like permease
MTDNAHSLSVAISLTSRQRGLWLIVFGGLLMGTLGVFVEEANQHPLTAVWFRCVFGLLALLVWGAATRQLGQLRLAGAKLSAAVAAGVLMLAMWGLFFSAISKTSIGVATVVFHIQPFWLMAMAAWWLKEPISRPHVAATCVALAGLVLATGLVTGQAATQLMTPSYVWGLVMCVGGSMCYAAVLLIAKATPGVSPFALVTWQCLTGTVLLAWWPWVHGWPQLGTTWFWLIGLGVIHTGLAYVILYAGMARLSAASIALLQFVYPATALVMDWLVYGRALSPIQMVGVALMGLAMWWVRLPARASK